MGRRRWPRGSWGLETFVMSPAPDPLMVEVPVHFRSRACDPTALPSRTTARDWQIRWRGDQVLSRRGRVSLIVYSVRRSHASDLRQRAPGLASHGLVVGKLNTGRLRVTYWVRWVHWRLGHYQRSMGHGSGE